MMTIPALALAADTILVRQVGIPAPWYDVATGILSIVATLLLLGIALAMLGMARALKAAEHSLGRRVQGLSEELIPLAKTLNQLALQLTDVTASARKDLQKLSGTVIAVDDAVRGAIEAGESRLAQLGVLVDVVQEEAEATVASATGVMRGVRTGAGSMFSTLFDRGRTASTRGPSRRAASRRQQPESLDESDIRARLAALEAAFTELDDDDEHEAEGVAPRGRRQAAQGRSDADDSFADWTDEEDDDDELDDIDYDDEDEADEEAAEDGEEDERDEGADEFDDDEDEDEPPVSDASESAEHGPRRGGPRIRERRRA